MDNKNMPAGQTGQNQGQEQKDDEKKTGSQENK